MNLQKFTDKIINFNDKSRVWIYQADRILTDNEVNSIAQELKPFISSWAHHGLPLKADFGVLYNLFIVFVVDETIADVGGCGIDKSVHIIQKITRDLKVDFFNRLAIAYFNEEKIACIDKDSFSELINTDQGWTEENLVFNNQINTLAALKNNWIIPFKNSWHKDFFETKDSFNLSL